MIAMNLSKLTKVSVKIEASQNSELITPCILHIISPKTQLYVIDETIVNGIPSAASNKSAIARFATNTFVIVRRRENR